MRRRVIIEDFGKIEHVELEMKPMMMFVGDNNSGKSYLMNLLWGFSSESSALLTDLTEDILNSDLYKECEQYMMEKIVEGEIEEILSAKWFIKFLKLLNLCIEHNKDHFVSEIFNKEMHIGKLKLDMEDEEKIEIIVENRSIYFEVTNRGRTNREKPDYIITEKTLWIRLFRYYQMGMQIEGKDALQRKRYVKFVLNMLLKYWTEISVQEGDPVFLPSSRTGFVLSKNLIINHMYENSFNRESDLVPSYFTKPVISFLKLLNSVGEIEGKNQELCKLAEFIEQSVLHGQVERQDTISRAFLYKPDNMNDSIQMYLASAVVTEITPLYLLCKYQHRISQMFIEEPEMCLHPQLQTAVAKVLVRMCSMGIPVIMTTHSDIIIQYINNMLRVNNSDKKQELMEKFQIEGQDLLEEDQVGVYQFACQGEGNSKIEELKSGAVGFETTTFSNAFEEMLELTYDI